MQRILSSITFCLLSLSMLIILPKLFQQGMFVDGVDYAAVALNMAQGNGSFWQPQMSETLFPIFYQHPPLAMGFMSLLFMLFGDGFWVEKVYALFIFYTNVLVLWMLWKEILPEPKNRSFAIPLLFFLSMPLSLWSVNAGILETTMAIFSGLAVWMSLRVYGKRSVLGHLFIALCLILAFFTKGFTGIFPLASFFFLGVLDSHYSMKQMLMDYLKLFVALFLLLGLGMWLFPMALDFVTQYIQIQVVGSIQNLQTVGSRFYIVWKIFTESIPSMLLLLGLYFLVRKKVHAVKIKIPFQFWFLLLTVLSGSLPMMISMKQRGFYLYAILPFLALLFGLLAHQILANRKENTRFHWPVLKWFNIVLLAVAILWSYQNYGSYNYAKERYENVEKIATIIGENQHLGIHKDLYESWDYHAIFSRFHHISLEVSKHNMYYLTPQGKEMDSEEFHPVELQLKGLTLWKKNP